MLHLEIQEVIVEMVNIYYIITVCVNVHQDRGQLLEFLNQRITQIGYIIVVNMQILEMIVISLNRYRFGDSNSYQEPQEVIQRRIYVVDEESKHILTRIEFMQKVILVGLLLFFVLCLKNA